MRRYLDIHLGARRVEERQWSGEDIVNAGRHFIAKTLLERRGRTGGAPVR